MKPNKTMMTLMTIGAAAMFACQAQIWCPIYAPPDPTVEGARRVCADTARLVAQLNAALPQNVQQETPLQQTQRFINQVRNEKDPERLRQMAARWQVIGQMADSQKQSALRERQRNAWEAKNRANEEFRRQTGRDFDNTVRPSTPGPLQDAYDACNRIHRIYNN